MRHSSFPPSPGFCVSQAPHNPTGNANVPKEKHHFLSTFLQQFSATIRIFVKKCWNICPRTDPMLSIECGIQICQRPLEIWFDPAPPPIRIPDPPGSPLQVQIEPPFPRWKGKGRKAANGRCQLRMRTTSPRRYANPPPPPGVALIFILVGGGTLPPSPLRSYSPKNQGSFFRLGQVFPPAP